MDERTTSEERLMADCERLALEIYGARTVVLLDQFPSHVPACHRAFLQPRGERLSHDPSRYGECYGSSPGSALSDLLALLRSKLTG
jgi:hypothetical protein